MEKKDNSEDREGIEPAGCNLAFEQEMKVAREVMRRYYNALRQLATK